MATGDVEPSDVEFIVQLKNLTGDVFEVQATHGTTLKEIKDEVFKQSAILQGAQKVMYKTKFCKDDSKTLADYDIQPINGVAQLKLIVRLMNLINQATVQGHWFMVSLNDVIEFNVNGDVFDNHMGGTNAIWKIIVKENSFGFTSDHDPEEYLWKPESVQPGIIKIVSELQHCTPKCGFWCRELNERTCEIMRETWPDHPHKPQEPENVEEFNL